MDSSKNYIILQNLSNITIYDISNGTGNATATNLRSRYLEYIHSIAVNPTIPLIAVEYDWHVVIYHLQTCQIVMSIVITPDLTGKLNLIRFSLGGLFLFTCFERTIRIYHTRNWRMVKSYTIEVDPIDKEIGVSISPDRRYIVFNGNNGSINTLYVHDSKFGNKNGMRICIGKIHDVHFVSDNALFCVCITGKRMDKIVFNCATMSNCRDDDIIRPRSLYSFYGSERIYHPTKDIHIDYTTYRCVDQNSNGTVTVNGTIISNVLTVDDGFSKVRTCFSADGTSLYSLMEDLSGTKFQVVQFTFDCDNDGHVTLSRVHGSTFNVESNDTICHAKYKI